MFGKAFSFLRDLLSGRERLLSTRPDRGRAPVETLEERRLMSAAAALAFAQPPVDFVAGGRPETPVVVQLVDADGNPVTAGRSTVALVATGAGKPARFVAAAVNGVARFPAIVLRTAGAYVLSASDGSLAPATSDAFNVLPAPAARLQFATAAGALASPFELQVKLLDRFGNVATTDAPAVTLTTVAHPPKAVVSGAFTVTAADGFATFDGLTVATAGRYSFRATGSRLVGAASGVFSITPPSLTGQVRYTISGPLEGDGFDGGSATVTFLVNNLPASTGSAGGVFTATYTLVSGTLTLSGTTADGTYAETVAPGGQNSLTASGDTLSISLGAFTGDSADGTVNLAVAVSPTTAEIANFSSSNIGAPAVSGLITDPAGPMLFFSDARNGFVFDIANASIASQPAS